MLAGLGIAGIILQTALIPAIQVSDVRPDLILVTALMAGLTAGPRVGPAFGFALGLVVDILNGRFIGLFAAATGAAVLLVALVGQKIYKDYTLVPILAGMVGTLLHGLVTMILLKLSGAAPELQVTVSTARTIAIEAVLNGVLTAAFFGLADRLRAWSQAGTAAGDARRPAPWL